MSNKEPDFSADEYASVDSFIDHMMGKLRIVNTIDQTHRHEKETQEIRQLENLKELDQDWLNKN